MSELKYYKLRHIVSALASPDFTTGVVFDNHDEVYYKSEADKVIAELKDDCAYWKTMALKNAEDNVAMAKQRAEAFKRERHHKYKRCLAIAEEWRSYATFCGMQSSCHNHRGFGKTAEKYTWKEFHAWKCVKRWLELADKFKEAK